MFSRRSVLVRRIRDSDPGASPECCLDKTHRDATLAKTPREISWPCGVASVCLGLYVTDSSMRALTSQTTLAVSGTHPSTLDPEAGFPRTCLEAA
jgi:hypothetical protein